MEKKGETCNNLVYHPSLNLGRTIVTKAETCLWLRDVNSKEIIHPLLHEHPERGGDKTDDKTCKPEDIHANVLGSSLEGRGRGGGIGCDHPTISEVIAGGLVRDALERVVHHVHWGRLETRIGCNQERGKNRGEETSLESYTIR